MKELSYTFCALAALALSACSGAQRAPIAAGTSPQAALDKVSMEISDATANQSAQLAPKPFQSAVDHRNAAAHAMAAGKDDSKVLDETAMAEHDIQIVQRTYDASKETLGAALTARTFAVQSQAPQFEKSAFESADSDLASLGGDIANGKPVSAEYVHKVETKYGKAEVAARKRAELGSTRALLKQAEDNKAEKLTPTLYNQAKAQISSAEHAIEMSPHNSAEYAAALDSAKASTQKLCDVLGIARAKNASEDVALTIYNQNQALAAERASLEKTRAEDARKLSDEQKAAADRLAQTEAAANAEKAKLESNIAERDQRINQQSDTLVAIDAQNQKYADKAQLEAKIQELKEKFDPKEAEVMKDGKNIVVRLKTMAFATGRSDLNPDAFSTLRKVEDLISAVPAQEVKVEGHTDSTGSTAKNKQLSEKRAESVKKYLLSQGLAENLKVETEGYGSDRPLTTNKTKEGRATNRRVDIVIETPVVL